MFCSQKLGEDFEKFCGLLRIYELYEQFLKQNTETEFQSIYWNKNMSIGKNLFEI